MHNFVQRFMRGVIFCVVTVAITACAGLNDGPVDEQSPGQPVAKSEQGLPRIAAIRLRVARNALENQDYNTAIRFFESVRNTAPNHPAPMLGIAQAHMAAGNHKDAIAAYRDVLDLQSGNDEALDGIARALVLTGDYRQAIEYFNRSLAKAPSAALHNRLGVAHDLAGDGEGAQRHYRAALALDPEAISPRNNLALSLAISENYEEAIKQIERVSAHPQATGKHRQNLSFIYGMAGENDEALAGLSEAGLTPSEIAENRALYKRIRAHARAGNRAAILEYLRNGREMGEPAMADNMSEPGLSNSEMAAVTPDGDLDPSSSAAPEAPEPLTDRKPEPMPLEPKKDRTAVVSDPVSSGSPRSGLAGMVYRVQLAAYRTSMTAVRGVRILAGILKEAAPVFEILVRDPRRTFERAIDFRIRTPQLPNQEAAMELCRTVRSSGHPDCLVILHNPRIWANVDQPDTPKVARMSKATSGVSGGTSIFAGAGGPVRLQLASFRTERAASRGLKILQKMLGDSLPLEIVVRRSGDAAPGGFRYQIRSGEISSRADGSVVCDLLKDQGHNGCLMVRHNDRVWRRLAGTEDLDTAQSGATDELREPSAEMVPEALNSGDIMPDQSEKSLLKEMPSADGMSTSDGDEDIMSEHDAIPDEAASDSVMSGLAPSTGPTVLYKKSTVQPEKSLLPIYRVQFASFRTEKAAVKGQAVLQKVLAGPVDILVRRARSGAPRAFDYQIRSRPIASRGEGMALCEKVKKAGHAGCLVIQHNDQIWKTVATSEERKKASFSASEAAAEDVPALEAPDGVDPVNLVIELPSESVMETGHERPVAKPQIVPSLSLPVAGIFISI